MPNLDNQLSFVQFKIWISKDVLHPFSGHSTLQTTTHTTDAFRKETQRGGLSSFPCEATLLTTLAIIISQCY